ncbi:MULTISPECIES: hypothetical protein [Streptomyces]|uniref:hypothetical protein n=1 Tax=Streptomyces TaxID=1883 RepID=UPI000A7B298D|nr:MULTISPECIES: hypothetical protein [Streptomyces]
MAFEHPQTVEKVEIRTDGAPAPAWMFSQGVRKGPILQVSGQGPQDPATGEYPSTTAT